ncbi:tail protein X [Niameybacter massiliensis]|uniref:Tail protein X n=1 Tax=Holtiella tumoricola TaxID=3018743 RepID=A0AA42J0X5_9FIRM|nr:tail protein X [Holtiella tumoricola]MDA3731673.1 tail protein X [Holtiella tumoricola]
MDNTYITSQGDTWDMISYKVYGNEKYVDKLIQSNLLYKETIIFKANVELSIPEVQIIQQSSLPPWKRGIV